MKTVVLAIATLSGLGFAFGLLLAWASKKFQVKVDPRITKVTEFLPGINCGTCGLAGCSSFAEAIVENNASVASCVACSPENKKEIAAILGLDAAELDKTTQIAVIGCGGGTHCKDKFDYQGLADCRAAALTLAGHKVCQYACLGQGTCIKVCPFGAIKETPVGVSKVDSNLCKGCRKCISVCPRKIIYMIDQGKEVFIKCSSQDKGAQVMKKCKVGCIACRKCLKACPLAAITIEDNLAKIDYSKCDNCKKCVEVCPTKVIHVL